MLIRFAPRDGCRLAPLGAPGEGADLPPQRIPLRSGERVPRPVHDHAPEQGRDPFSDRPKLGAGLALRARLADLEVLLGRPVVEDAVVLARRS
jgi:hypothetical protein